MRPSEALRQYREAIRQLIERASLRNPLDIVCDTVQKSLPDLERELAVICSELADARQ